jgi:hypothetical protein
MVIHLTEELETVLSNQARRRGVSVEDVALAALESQFLKNRGSVDARDDWERLLFNAALDCGVSVPDWALSSEGLYE